MEAGIELDGLIAEKVMGLRVEVTQEECSQFTDGARWVDGGEYHECDVYWAIPPARYQAWLDKDDDGDGEWYLKPYSADFCAALDILTKFRSWTLGTSDRNVRKYNCSVWGGGLTPPTGSAWGAATPELAICLAALKAVGAL